MNILNKDKILEAARAFIEEGKFDKAIREYEKILLADPSDMRVKLRVAELYTKRRQINDAIRIYREVADAYAAEGFYLKAVTVHKNILRLNPSLSDTNEQLALLYEKMGLMNDAVRQYDILASSLDLKGQKDRVIEIRNKIVRLVPKDGSARVKLAEIYQREGRMEEAIDQYEEYAKQVEESGGEKGKLADLFE
ncbi:MAG TPA: tetratricopeptide repeat protein, partial [bacterium]|nr:tetratricopeptide repeat protein [bacterium]